MVYPQQSLVHPIWRTPSSGDLYEKINFGQQLFDPPNTSSTTDIDVGPSHQPIDHLVKKNINTTTTSAKFTSET
jgi:hypothetical protein